MGRDLYSTFQAAKVLGVSPDTVLKWIKAGKIPASRTLGGHYRIRGHTIEELLSTRESPYPSTNVTTRSDAYRYCWEFNAEQNTLRAECRHCVVYRSRAKLCYELNSIPGKIGHMKVFCESECDDCGYHKYIKERSHPVLLITDDREFLGDLRDSDSVSLKVTNCEYECSAMVERMRPEIAVIDCSFRKSKEFYDYLTHDPRIPDIGIILATDTEVPFDYDDQRVVGIVCAPLTIDKVEEYVKSIAA